ncbi:DUF6884 domain-containing protein [Nocardiopsis aegyptia]|uniref:Uncharacterized protein n=1 Tax=Nocardiopsis aegyptia TaxID=220378 RepID=A0A7Z0EV03_9ACTN|nr:DUF6884 domain-containing protein [Nocardiopsis aegyptia]NYJ37798.1 hypothetical protein [Nocardiopsis aegyptia]
MGCVKTKADTAMAARDLYQSTLFRERRRYAERSGVAWYVLSARWGLVGPAEVIAPYDLYLGDRSPAFRRAWGSFVAAQLTEHVSLPEATVEIHAGGHYVEALRGPLVTAGARVHAPLAGLSMGRTLAWYQNPPGPAGAGDPHESLVESEAEDIIARLSGPERVVPAHLLRTHSRPPAEAGLYSWWVDTQGAQDLSAGLGRRIDPGIIYVGQAGATRQPSGKVSDNTLYLRLVTMHLGGRAEFSTLRLSLASVLAARLGLTPQREQPLTAWMERHLGAVTVTVGDRDRLGTVEKLVLRRMDPPLNLGSVPETPVRRRLGELRRAWRAS